MTLKNTLMTVRQTLAERGWARGDLIQPDGCLCILGAVGLVTVPDFENNQDYYYFTEGQPLEVVEALREQLPFYKHQGYIFDEGDYSDLYSYNDVDADEEAIFDLIDAAIEAAE